MLAAMSKVSSFLLFYCVLFNWCKMAGRIVQFSRSFSSSRKLQDSLKEPLKVLPENHHLESMKLWKKLFFIVCCPAIGIGFLNEALAEEEKPPEFIKYSHLRIRKKPYPWRDGVKSLFHNPHKNALPDGYEVIEGHH